MGKLERQSLSLPPPMGGFTGFFLLPGKPDAWARKVVCITDWSGKRA